jgi:hypothetical protein
MDCFKTGDKDRFFLQGEDLARDPSTTLRIGIVSDLVVLIFTGLEINGDGYARWHNIFTCICLIIKHFNHDK